jgi:hypothetical protein
MSKSGPGGRDVPDDEDFPPWIKKMRSFGFSPHYLRTQYPDESSARGPGSFNGNQHWKPWMCNITKTGLVDNACTMSWICASLAPDPRTFGSCYLLLTITMLVVRHLCPVVDGSAYVKEITVLLNEGALTLVEENNEADEKIKLEDGNIRAYEVQLFCQDEPFRQGVYEKIKTILEQKGKLTGTTAPRAAKKPRRDEKPPPPPTSLAEAAEAPAAAAAAPAPAAEAEAAGAAEAEAIAVEAEAETPATVQIVLPKAAAPAKASALPRQHPMALLADMKW